MREGIDQGRAAFDRQAWGRAYEHLSAAEEDEPLEVDDLERLASSAYLAGRSEVSTDIWSRAHQRCAEIGEVARAARCGFWLAFALLNSGDVARGGGWVDRAQRLLDDRKLDCVEQGYLRYAAAMRATFSGDVEAGNRWFREAVGIGERYRDPELITLARIGEGRCLIYLGDVERGVALLDEAMVAVSANEVSPIATGDAYCTVIEGCHELFDVHRAQVWTTAFSSWCDGQPELVLYRGECLVHRGELMLLRGEWSDALDEVDRTLARLAHPTEDRILGATAYLRGELHRLRGEVGEADRAYQIAREAGRDPQPGVALLRMAQGRADVADATIRRALGEAEDPITRARLLWPYVEIVLSSGDVEAARLAADELTGVAEILHRPLLHAIAEHMNGMTLLAEEHPDRALTSLRRAWRGWHDLQAPHEAARARVLIALACRALGDDDSAEMELDAARSAFAALGAAPDLAWVGSLSTGSPTALPDGLTAREVEVLVLVAQGRTNREIAEALFISEKTVASHLSHMFTKLGVTSRSAATAYAYEHGLT